MPSMPRLSTPARSHRRSAQRGEDQRRRDPKHRSPEAGRGDDVENLAHRRILYWVKKTAISMVSSDRATMTSAM